jgi:hypothetical protein
VFWSSTPGTPNLAAFLATPSSTAGSFSNKATPSQQKKLNEEKRLAQQFSDVAEWVVLKVVREVIAGRIHSIHTRTGAHWLSAARWSPLRVESWPARLASVSSG